MERFSQARTFQKPCGCIVAAALIDPIDPDGNLRRSREFESRGLRGSRPMPIPEAMSSLENCYHIPAEN